MLYSTFRPVKYLWNSLKVSYYSLMNILFRVHNKISSMQACITKCKQRSHEHFIINHFKLGYNKIGLVSYKITGIAREIPSFDQCAEAASV